MDLEKAATRPQPMTVGNIVSATISLYRARFGDYFALAGQSVLWILPPLLLLALAIALMVLGVGVSGDIASGEVVNEQLLGVGVLLLVVAMVVGIYCLTRSMVCDAAISRLAFFELRQTPETRKDAHRFVRRRMWKFLLASLLIGLLILAVYILIVIAVFVITFVMAIIAGVVMGGDALTNSPENNLIFGLIAILLTFVLIFGVLILFLWMSARLFVYDTTLAIEEKVAVMDTLGISWRLTKRNTFRIILVMVVTVLVSLPVGIVVQIIAAIAQPILSSLIPLPTNIQDAIAVFIGVAIGLLGNLILLPLWQILKSVIYYDLKSRKEGIDLQLSDT